MTRKRPFPGMRREPHAACPFCEAKVRKPTPAPPQAGLDCSIGRCACGADFLLDETGKQGGQRVLDALTLAGEGDLDRGLELRAGVDYELRGVGYNPRTHSLDLKSNKRYGAPKLYFIRRLPPAGG